MPADPSTPAGPLDAEVVEALRECSLGLFATAILALNDAIAEQGAAIAALRGDQNAGRAREGGTWQSAPPAPSRAPESDPTRPLPEHLHYDDVHVGGGWTISVTPTDDMAWPAVLEVLRDFVSERPLPPSPPPTDEAIIDRLQDAEGLLREQLAEARAAHDRLREGVERIAADFDASARVEEEEGNESKARTQRSRAVRFRALLAGDSTGEADASRRDSDRPWVDWRRPPAPPIGEDSQHG